MGRIDYGNYKQRLAIEAKNKKRWLAVNPNLTDHSGIYFLTREEDGFKYAYIGQAKHILSRLAQHLVGYQHIDLSLKKHGLYSEDNPTGWKVGSKDYPITELDEMEQFYILKYAQYGYQLRNKTSGSQGTGKAQIDEYKPAKGYRDGIKQGKINLARQLSDIISKHLVVTVRPDKANNKVSIKQYEKFKELIDEETYQDGEK